MAQEEFIIKGLNSLDEKIDSKREILFCLDDLSVSLNKEYYFTFVVTQNGFVSISFNNIDGQITAFIDNIPLIINSEFYLKKGVYQVKVLASFNTISQSIRVNVKGSVKYYNTSYVKVLNLQNYSLIAIFKDEVLSLYKYTGDIILLETLSAKSYDYVVGLSEVYLCYVQDNVLKIKTYYDDLSSSAEQFIEIDNLAEVKCYFSEKLGLYILKDGQIYLLDSQNTNNLTPLNLKAKNLLAVEKDSLVYRDFNGKIKLCSFSVSPNKIN